MVAAAAKSSTGSGNHRLRALAQLQGKSPRIAQHGHVISRRGDVDGDVFQLQIRAHPSISSSAADAALAGRGALTVFLPRGGISRRIGSSATGAHFWESYQSMKLRWTMLCCLGSLTTVSGDPGPGDVFREFVWRGPFVNAGNWQRVTDPNASHAGAQEFLPNPVNVIRSDDLTMAIGAEVTIELWGGHAGTSNRRLRINGGDWIAIGEPPGIPGDAGLHPDPQCYQYFTYPSVTIPLDALRLGDNTFEFTSGGQTCFDFGWGQWGLWGAIFRVFYDADKPHASGRIVSPAGGPSFDDTLRIALAADPTVGADDAIARVDVMARYERLRLRGQRHLA
jgi:hypothetical protein